MNAAVRTTPALAGKRLLITGIVNRESIAYATAERAQQAGAELLLTAFPRDRALTEAAAAALPRSAEIVDADLTSREDLDNLTERAQPASALSMALCTRSPSLPETRWAATSSKPRPRA